MHSEQAQLPRKKLSSTETHPSLVVSKRVAATALLASLVLLCSGGAGLVTTLVGSSSFATLVGSFATFVATLALVALAVLVAVVLLAALGASGSRGRSRSARGSVSGRRISNAGRGSISVSGIGRAIVRCGAVRRAAVAAVRRGRAVRRVRAVGDGLEVDAVVDAVVLRKGDGDRHVVGTSGDTAQTVESSGDTASNISGQDAIDSRGVETLEESELRSRDEGGVLEARNRTNNDMRVTIDQATVSGYLGSPEVVGVRIDEETSIDVSNAELDGELRVFRNGTKVCRENELRDRCICLRRDDTHGDGVARAVVVLRSISDLEIGLSEAEVDEVVLGRGTGYLVRFGRVQIQASLPDVGTNLAFDEAKGFLRVAVETVIVVVVVVTSARILGRRSGNSGTKNGERQQQLRRADHD